jgi:two-component system cell cycle response regulator
MTKELPVLLLVDDHDEIIEFLRSILEEEYSLLVAPDGQRAIQILLTEIVHLVVSDIIMPVMDGFSLCRSIKENPDISHVPVILLTAKNTLQSKIEGLELGADAYIEKPFSGAHLKAQIKNLLNSREHLRTVFTSRPLVPVQSVVHTSSDIQFVERLSDFILLHIDDEELGIDQLADAMNMSRMSLYRKLKAVAGLSPHEFINITRLKKAATLLSMGEYRIFEVAMSVGYKSTTHFGKLFNKQFGMSPTQFAQSLETR